MPEEETKTEGRVDHIESRILTEKDVDAIALWFRSICVAAEAHWSAETWQPFDDFCKLFILGLIYEKRLLLDDVPF